MPLDLFTDDLDAFDDEQLFAAIAEFSKAMPTEGWRHDYKVEWGDSALASVAASANTFGGILIVGVKKSKSDLACDLVGVESELEYKTRIASSIAANISPVPSFNVYECCHPKVPKRRFCVIRVHNNKLLHLITLKNRPPLYVRNEDETRPANAAQLRALIEREREAPKLTENMAERARRVDNALQVGCGYQNENVDTWKISLHQSSPTFLKLILIPTYAIQIELEKSHEDRFAHLLEGIYRRIQHARSTSLCASERGADYYQHAWYHKGLDYEQVWRITATGEIGHATQMATSGTWSLVDLAFHMILFTHLCLQWWRSVAYFGDGRLHARINLPGLKISRARDGWYNRIFDPSFSTVSGFRRKGIQREAVTLGSLPRDAANAETHFLCLADHPHSARLAATLMNQLLRSLGHVVALSLLEENIRSMVDQKSPA